MNDTKLCLLGLVMITTLALPAPARAEASATNLTVTASALHLRRSHGTHSKSLELLRRGTIVVTTGRAQAGWLEVEAAGRRGWVKDDYVTEAAFCAACQRKTAAANENPLLRAGRKIAKTIQDTGDAVFTGVLRYAGKLSRVLHVGYRVGAFKCWRAVWEDLKAANLVSGELTQNYAKNALIDLSRFGFRHDPRACKTPGVVRVYDSARRGHGLGTPGDYAGHVEILGRDGRYHHFTASGKPMNERVGEATRPLKYCLVK